MDFVSLAVRKEEKVPEVTYIEAVTEVPAFPQNDFPGAKITFKGFIPGFDPENMTLNPNADAGDLSMILEIAGQEKQIFGLDENGVWSEI